MRKSNARSFLESKSKYQISLWFKSVGSYPPRGASCLAFSWFTQEQGLNIPELGEPCPSRQGWGQETSDGDTQRC